MEGSYGKAIENYLKAYEKQGIIERDDFPKLEKLLHCCYRVHLLSKEEYQELSAYVRKKSQIDQPSEGLSGDREPYASQEALQQQGQLVEY